MFNIHTLLTHHPRKTKSCPPASNETHSPSPSSSWPGVELQFTQVKTEIRCASVCARGVCSCVFVCSWRTTLRSNINALWEYAHCVYNLCLLLLLFKNFLVYNAKCVNDLSLNRTPQKATLTICNPKKWIFKE